MSIVALSVGQELDVSPYFHERDRHEEMHGQILLKPKPTNHVYRASGTSHENRVLSEGKRVRTAQF